MFKVYILESVSKPGKTYVGLTIKEVKARLGEHNDEKSKSTKSYVPWNLIYYENFYCKLDAEKREQFLKSGFGYRFRKLILENHTRLK